MIICITESATANLEARIIVGDTGIYKWVYEAKKTDDIRYPIHQEESSHC